MIYHVNLAEPLPADFGTALTMAHNEFSRRSDKGRLRLVWIVTAVKDMGYNAHCAAEQLKYYKGKSNCTNISQPGAIARSVAMLLGNQEAPRSILAAGTSFREDLVMKLFLRLFFLFR